MTLFKERKLKFMSVCRMYNGLLDDVKRLVIGEAPSLEFAPQSCGCREETFPTKLPRINSEWGRFDTVY